MCHLITKVTFEVIFILLDIQPTHSMVADFVPYRGMLACWLSLASLLSLDQRVALLGRVLAQAGFPALRCPAHLLLRSRHALFLTKHYTKEQTLVVLTMAPAASLTQQLSALIILMDEAAHIATDFPIKRPPRNLSEQNGAKEQWNRRKLHHRNSKTEIGWK